MADRRGFLAGMLAASLCPAATWADAGSPAYLSAGLRPDGVHVLCGLGTGGQILFELAVPGRGHAAAAHPLRAEAVAFARRPGRFAVVIDCATGHQVARLSAPAGRHFYGHGAFSGDGALLFTSENDYEAARGVIGVWDARKGYRRVGAFASGGVGPHDIKLMPDGQSLVVANGGIETHPDTGRAKLNLPMMRPNLSFLGLDGAPKGQVTLDAALHKNSIRHLALAGDGTVAFAMQWQGDQSAHPPLLGLWAPDRAVQLVQAPPDQHRQMAGYAGSVAISGPAGQVAVTSPRGGACQLFDLAAGRFVRQVALEDVCGVAPGAAGFALTNGLGQVMHHSPQGDHITARHPIRWDNHLIQV